MKAVLLFLFVSAQAFDPYDNFGSYEDIEEESHESLEDVEDELKNTEVN